MHEAEIAGLICARLGSLELPGETKEGEECL